MSKRAGKQSKQPDPKAKHVVARNRRARHDYHLERPIEAGIVLAGTEVKSLREGRASIVDGWVHIDRGEVWLENVHIPEYMQGSWTNHSSRRKRKLLLHKAEILKLEQAAREKGHTIVPLELYFIDGRAKIEIAVGRGKQEWDKRQALREKQDQREAQRAMSLRRNLA